jgi:hypothetical protein
MLCPPTNYAVDIPENRTLPDKGILEITWPLSERHGRNKASANFQVIHF